MFLIEKCDKNIWYICWIENSEELVDLLEQSFFKKRVTIRKII